MSSGNDTIILPPKTPNCKKLSDRREEHRFVCSFMEFLEEKGLEFEIGTTPRSLIAEYFGIDEKEMDRERRELLAYCRAQNTLCNERKELRLNE